MVQSLLNHTFKLLVTPSAKLQNLLAERKWKEADQETARLMLKIANREEEGWLTVEDIDSFPCSDLYVIDRLWLKASNGHFGLSVQKQIYQELGGTRDYQVELWRRFADEVGWRVNGYWRVYDKFTYDNLTFDLSAPKGHLPMGAATSETKLVGYKRVLYDRLENCQSVTQLESVTFETNDEIIESSSDNETLPIPQSITDNQQLISENNYQNIPMKNRYDNSIRIIGERGAGKTTYLAALAYSSRVNYEIPYNVIPLNEDSRHLLEMARDVLLESLLLKSTYSPKLVEELPFYNYNIYLKPSFLGQPFLALRGKNIEMNLSFLEYPGELFNDLRSNRTDRYLYSSYIDDCATVSKLLFLIDGTTRDDRGYGESVNILLKEIAKRLDTNKKELSQYRIAIVISKCEEPLLWLYRNKPKELISKKFPATKLAFERFSQLSGCKINYFTCSSFGVMGNPPRPNFEFIRTDERGIMGVIAKPSQWKPFGLLAPIYWLETGKNDPRLR